jgi:hypothetical protein
MNKIKLTLAIILWFALLFLVALNLTSCGKPKNKIQNGDFIIKCRIDSIHVLPQHSSIEPDRKWEYFTSCNTKIVGLSNSYKLGDSVTYVLNKINNQKN